MIQIRTQRCQHKNKHFLSQLCAHLLNILIHTIHIDYFFYLIKAIICHFFDFVLNPVPMSWHIVGTVMQDIGGSIPHRVFIYLCIFPYIIIVSFQYPREEGKLM